MIIWCGGASVIAGAISLGTLAAFRVTQRFCRPSATCRKFVSCNQHGVVRRIFKLSTASSDHVTASSLPRRSSPEASERRRGLLPSSTSGLPITKALGAPGRVVRRQARSGWASSATSSGKTTLINLLRFYDVQRGRILVDGIDIREMTARTCAGSSASCCRTSTCSGHDCRQHPAGRSSMDDSASARGARGHAITSLNGCRDAAARGGGGRSLSVGQAAALFAQAGVRTAHSLWTSPSSVDTETELLIQDALEL